MKKQIPYSTQFIADEDIQAVVEALRSDWLTQGPRIEEFEKEMARYCGAKYAVAVNSGTSALHLACLVAGIGKEDEVITSPITFVASANCVLYCGGKPVFADIQEDTINIEPEEIKKNVTSKTKAIIPVHFAGHPCDMEEIRTIAEQHDLIIVEDASHALGAEYRGSKIGSCKYSDMSVLSFHAVKHITTGEGGMVLTNNKIYYDRLRMLRTHGIIRDKNMLINADEGAWYYEMQSLGFNYRITDIQCALGLSQLSNLPKRIARRQEIARCYDNAFSELEGVSTLKLRNGVVHSYHLYILLFNTAKLKKTRREIFQALRDNGIMVNVHYIPIHLHPYYREMFGVRTGLCPTAEKVYQHMISLPMFYGLDDNDVERVIEEVKKNIRKN